MAKEVAGLIKLQIKGGAQVSDKHAGFIVNIGDATCQDIVRLADKVTRIVLEEKGVQLEKEMIIV